MNIDEISQNRLLNQQVLHPEEPSSATKLLSRMGAAQDYEMAKWAPAYGFPDLPEKQSKGLFLRKVLFGPA